MMVYHMGYPYAKKFATAHKDFTEAQLGRSTEDGFTLRDHVLMDLHNNAVGRIIGNDTIQRIKSSGKPVGQILIDILRSQNEVRRMELKCGLFGADLIMAVDCANAVSDGRLRSVLP